MLNHLRISAIWVLDQDQALDFYVGKLGMQVHTDNDLGFMRFLTVSLPSDPDRQVLLETPSAPYLDPATAEQVRDVLTKGRAGGQLFFVTDDARNAFENLSAKGIDVTQKPTEQPYGIDFGMRDPFGNHIRVAQLRDAPVPVV